MALNFKDKPYKYGLGYQKYLGTIESLRNMKQPGATAWNCPQCGWALNSSFNNRTRKLLFNLNQCKSECRMIEVENYCLIWINVNPSVEKKQRLSFCRVFNFKFWQNHNDTCKHFYNWLNLIFKYKGRSEFNAFLYFETSIDYHSFSMPLAWSWWIFISIVSSRLKFTLQRSPEKN